MAANDDAQASPATIQEHLSGVDYPMAKQDLVRTAKDQNAPAEVVKVLEQVEDREYESPADLMQAIGRVE